MCMTTGIAMKTALIPLASVSLVTWLAAGPFRQIAERNPAAS